jgi:hypothetical protein
MSRHGALGALLVTAVSGTVLCAAGLPAAIWSGADRVAAWRFPWSSVGLLPVGDLGHRPDFLACALLLATCVTAAWAGYALFRGRARLLASLTAGVLTALVLLDWLVAANLQHALTALPVALLTTLGVTELVRSLVHRGYVTPLATSRALAATSGVVLLDAPWGIASLGLVSTVAWARADRHPARRWATAVLLGLAPALLAALGLLVATGTHTIVPLAWRPVTLELGLPPLDLLERHLPAAALYPALAFLVLLVMPLRWRGGPTLVLLATVSLVLHDGGRPLAPIPVLLVLACVATAGWVWLAGTAWPRFPRLDRLQAASAAMAVLVLVAMHTRELGARTAVEHPAGDLARLHDAALEQPGAVLLLHDSSVHRLLADRRRVEGWRPDIELTDAMAIDDEDLLAATSRWHAQGRPVLADSFDAAGRWPAQWVVEHGPLFAYVGPEVGHEPGDAGVRAEQAWVRLRARGHSLSPIERGQLVRHAVERARFRRMVGDPHAALEALELSTVRQQALETRLRLAITIRPHSGVGSELPGGPVDRAWLPRAWPEHRGASQGTHPALTAEAGDLLYAHGERERAVELLAEAAAEGHRPAWGALARWQLRAGEGAAHETLRAMASDPGLRHELLGTVEWLLARQRTVDAHDILCVTPAVPGSELDELATRLMLLHQLAP